TTGLVEIGPKGDDARKVQHLCMDAFVEILVHGFVDQHEICASIGNTSQEWIMASDVATPRASRRNRSQLQFDHAARPLGGSDRSKLEHYSQSQGYPLQIGAAQVAQETDEPARSDRAHLKCVRSRCFVEAIAVIRIEPHQPVASPESLLPTGDRNYHAQRQYASCIAAHDYGWPDLADLVAYRRIEIDEPDFTPGQSHQEC